MKLTWQEVYDFVLSRDDQLQERDIDELYDEYVNSRNVYLEWTIYHPEEAYEEFPGWLYGLWGIYSTKLQEFDEIGFFLKPQEAIATQEADLADAECVAKQLIPFEYVPSLDQIEVAVLKHRAID